MHHAGSIVTTVLLPLRVARENGLFEGQPSPILLVNPGVPKLGKPLLLAVIPYEILIERVRTGKIAVCCIRLLVRCLKGCDKLPLPLFSKKEVGG